VIPGLWSIRPSEITINHYQTFRVVIIRARLDQFWQLDHYWPQQFHWIQNKSKIQLNLGTLFKYHVSTTESESRNLKTSKNWPVSKKLTEKSGKWLHEGVLFDPLKRVKGAFHLTKLLIHLWSIQIRTKSGFPMELKVGFSDHSVPRKLDHVLKPNLHQLQSKTYFWFGFECFASGSKVSSGEKLPSRALVDQK